MLLIIHYGLDWVHKLLGWIWLGEKEPYVHVRDKHTKPPIFSPKHTYTVVHKRWNTHALCRLNTGKFWKRLASGTTVNGGHVKHRIQVSAQLQLTAMTEANHRKKHVCFSFLCATHYVPIYSSQYC